MQALHLLSSVVSVSCVCAVFKAVLSGHATEHYQDMSIAYDKSVQSSYTYTHTHTVYQDTHRSSLSDGAEELQLSTQSVHYSSQ